MKGILKRKAEKRKVPSDVPPLGRSTRSRVASDAPFAIIPPVDPNSSSLEGAERVPLISSLLPVSLVSTSYERRPSRKVTLKRPAGVTKGIRPRGMEKGKGKEKEKEVVSSDSRKTYFFLPEQRKDIPAHLLAKPECLSFPTPNQLPFLLL